MINSEIEKEVNAKMQKTMEAFMEELAKLRTGRASPSLLEGVMVPYYGTPTKLNNLASIVTEDARTLAITPYEKSIVTAIDKAIRTADLGLNPLVAGDTIRVPMPALTEEQRQKLVKQAKAIAENARVAARNVRRDVLQNVKNLHKDKAISDDEKRRYEDKIQKIIDQCIKNIDDKAHKKEADLMQV